MIFRIFHFGLNFAYTFFIRSQRVFIQMTSELVRLKVLDPYFTKIKKLHIPPQSPLIYEVIGEALKTQV